MDPAVRKLVVACGVVRGPVLGVGTGSADPFEIRVKAMEAVQILNCSREGLPGVWGAERIDGDGGNGEALPGPVTRFDHRTDRIVKVVVNR